MTRKNNQNQHKNPIYIRLRNAEKEHHDFQGSIVNRNGESYEHQNQNWASSNNVLPIKKDIEIKIEILTSAKSRIYFIQISIASSCMEEKHGANSDFIQNNPVTHKQMPDIA